MGVKMVRFGSGLGHVLDTGAAADWDSDGCGDTSKKERIRKMANSRAKFFISILLLSPLHLQQSSAENGGFDLFVLAIYRTAHVCAKYNKNNCCFVNECCRIRPKPEFTIHSFWPNYANLTSWPRCCTKTKLDQKQVSDLIPALEEFWPPLECGPANHLSHCDGTKSLIWEHEWEVHGTCSSPEITDQYSYFAKGLELYSKYNLEHIFNSAGYHGSNTVKYPLKNIISMVEKAVGATPLVECEHGSLMQIRLCFEKDYTPRACAITNIGCPDYIRLASSGRSVLGGDVVTPVTKSKFFNPLSVA